MTPEIPPSPASPAFDSSANGTPEPAMPQPVYEGPTWEDDENRATLVLRAAFTFLATGFLAWAQWHAPEGWIGGIGENWGKWVMASVLCNLVLPLGIVQLFFGQTLKHISWLKDQRNNAWDYGVGWAQFPLDLTEDQHPVWKLSRLRFRKWWHPMYWNAQAWSRKRWKRHILMALACWAVFLPFLIYFSRNMAMRAAYAEYLPPVSDVRSWAWMLSTLILYMFCWEWFFRGFALFGMAQGFGFIAAIGLQAGIFGLSHLGKPPVEMWSAFAGGLVLGTLSWREKSFLPSFLIHALIHVTWAVLVLV